MTFFGCGGPALTLTAGQVASFHLENPVGSGYLLLINKASVYASAAGGMEFVEGATSSGTTRTPFDLDRATNASPIGVFKSGVGVLTGGTVLDANGRVDPSAPWMFEGAIVLAPGQSMAVRYTAPAGLGTTAMVYCLVSWTRATL